MQYILIVSIVIALYKLPPLVLYFSQTLCTVCKFYQKLTRKPIAVKILSALPYLILRFWNIHTGTMNDWLDKNRFTLFAVLTAAAIVSFGWIYTHPQAEASRVYIEVPTVETATPTVMPPTETPIPTNTPTPLRVYISGEVQHPDVYVLPPGSIIKDAITAAGGTTPAADIDVVNLAQELADQQHIHIPAKSDNAPTPPVVEGGVRAAGATIAVPATTPTPLKININTATLQEFELLPGIGPSIAQRIVDYRAENGNFNAIEDIMKVRGIGQATFEKLQPNITVQ